MFNRKVQRQKRHLRLRQRVIGTAERPRMSICITNKNMYVQFIDDDAGKTLKTLGKINSHYAMTEYGVAAQPFYVLLSPSGEVLSTRSYDLDVEAFKTWLSSVK